MSMALQREVDFCGRPASYWRIISFQLDYLAQEAQACVALYFDEAARRNDPKGELRRQWITVAVEEGEFANLPDPRDRLYARLKEAPAFSGAADV
jgi:hypothetical protein